ARYGITWGVIGSAQACLAQLLDYTKTRVLFGRPLAANQAIQIRLASMARGITGARLMWQQLGIRADPPRPQPRERHHLRGHRDHPPADDRPRIDRDKRLLTAF